MRAPACAPRLDKGSSWTRSCPIASPSPGLGKHMRPSMAEEVHELNELKRACEAAGDGILMDEVLAEV